MTKIQTASQMRMQDLTSHNSKNGTAGGKKSPCCAVFSIIETQKGYKILPEAYAVRISYWGGV